MAGLRQGKAMGTAWERHYMSELAFTGSLLKSGFSNDTVNIQVHFRVD
jgi:hypothetical protein